MPAHGQAPNGAGVAQQNPSSFDARELRKLADHDHDHGDFSVSRLCALLGLPRSTALLPPLPVRK